MPVPVIISAIIAWWGAAAPVIPIGGAVAVAGMGITNGAALMNAIQLYSIGGQNARSSRDAVNTVP